MPMDERFKMRKGKRVNHPRAIEHVALHAVARFDRLVWGAGLVSSAQTELSSFVRDRIPPAGCLTPMALRERRRARAPGFEHTRYRPR